MKNIQSPTIDAINTVEPKRDFLPQHHQRVAVVLNIGLADNPYSGLSQALRAKCYAGDIVDLLAAHGDLLPLNWRVSQNTNVLLQTYVPADDQYNARVSRDQLVMWSEKVTEPTDVIAFDIEPCFGSKTTTEQAVRSLTARLAIHLNQGAIAATYADEGARDISNRDEGALIVGILAGERAHDWGGNWDKAHFQRFNASVDNIAAKFKS